jgi:hypothetical protein
MPGDNTKRLLAKYYQAGGTSAGLTPLVGADDGYGTSPGFDSFNNVQEFFNTGYGNASINWRGYARIPNIPVLPGETVTSAVMALVGVFENGAGVCNLRIHCNDEDNSVAPTNLAETRALSLTTASSDWSTVRSVTGTPYNTPNFNTPVQEVIDRLGWAFNNAITVIFESNAALSARAFASFESTTYTKPTLTLIINAIGSSKVIDSIRSGIAIDSDNVLNDEALLAYDTLLGGFKGIEKSTDGTMAGNSDDAIPTEKAVKTYADTKVSENTPVSFTTITIGNSPNYSQIAACGRVIPYGSASGPIFALPIATDNASAATAGVKVGGLYRADADPSTVYIRTA